MELRPSPATPRFPRFPFRFPLLECFFASLSILGINNQEPKP